MQTLEFDLTPDDFIAYNLRFYRTSEVVSKQRNASRLAGAALALLMWGFILWFLSGSLAVGVIFALLGAVVGWMLAPPMWEFTVRRQLAKMASQTGLGTVGRHRLTIEESGLREETEHGTNTTEWAGIERIDETADYAFIFFGPLQAYMLPKRDNAAGVERFLTEVRQRRAGLAGSDSKTEEERSMSQSAPEDTAPQRQSPETSSTMAELATSVRKLRLWLMVLTLVVSLAFVGACGIVALSTNVFFGGMGEPGSTGQRVENIRDEIKSALGDKLDRLEVRVVSVDYGVPFPFSLVPGGPGENSVYLEYQLKGSDVVIADVVEGPFGEPSPSGVLPTRGTLTSRMTDRQFERILAAYASETEMPLGSVRRYNDQLPAEIPTTNVPATLSVGGRQYASKELWIAKVGLIVKGDRVDLGADSYYERKGLVFYEDPKTGTFKYLGTEPGRFP